MKPSTKVVQDGSRVVSAAILLSVLPSLKVARLATEFEEIRPIAFLNKTFQNS